MNFTIKTDDKLIGVVETTVWSTKTPNNFYILSSDKSKLYSFRRQNDKKWKTYDTPLRFNTKGRTFKVLVP
jgi:hypothetical protein